METKYMIDEDGIIRDKADTIDFIDDYLTYTKESVFDDGLDEDYGIVEVAGMKFNTSRALKKLDPIAYKCAYDDWINSLMIDYIFELEKLSHGEELKVFDLVIKAVESEE